MLTTDQKGAVAEAAIVHAALELGIAVSRPLVDVRYDLIFDIASSLIRVQCKWASREGDVIVLRCYSARRNADGLVRRLYSRDEIDAIAAYCADVGRCYFVPFDRVPRGGTLGLRLAGTRNNQRRRINWAEDYEFGATLEPLGAVAQLGERVAASDEAAGSSPAGSISEAAPIGRLRVI